MYSKSDSYSKNFDIEGSVFTLTCYYEYHYWHTYDDGHKAVRNCGFYCSKMINKPGGWINEINQQKNNIIKQFSEVRDVCNHDGSPLGKAKNLPTTSLLYLNPKNPESLGTMDKWKMVEFEDDKGKLYEVPKCEPVVKLNFTKHDPRIFEPTYNFKVQDQAVLQLAQSFVLDLREELLQLPKP